MTSAGVISRLLSCALLALTLTANAAHAGEGGAGGQAGAAAEPKAAAKKAEQAERPAEAAAAAAAAAKEKEDARKDKDKAGAPGNVRVEPSGRRYALVVFYIVLILAFPFAMMWYDLRKAYAFAGKTRMVILEKAAADGLTYEELKLLLNELSQSPPGIPGLARNSIAFMLMMILGVALVHILAVDPPVGDAKIPETVDRILVLLTGLLTSVVSFYFGSRAAETAQASANLSTAPGGSAKPPSITFTPTSGPVGTSVTLSGAGFGTTPGKVTFNGGAAATPMTWNNGQIVVTVPAGAATGPISVTASGRQPVTSSANFTVTPTAAGREDQR